VLSVLYIALHSFEQLIEAFILASLPFWALSVGSVMVLRRTRPEAVRVYRTPGYPAVPLLFVVAMVALLGNSLQEHPETTIASIGGVLAGVPLYWWWRRTDRTPGGA
jgi:amino acid transporter